MKLLKKYSLGFLLKLLGVFIFMNFFAVEEVLAQSEIYSNPGTYTYTVPEGVTKIRVHVWGGGGAGGRRTIYTSGSGGGGAYSYSEIDVNPGETYDINVGSGGVSSNNNDDRHGKDSYIALDGVNKVLAKGGKGVGVNIDIGGAGGLNDDGIGVIKFSGGNGANGEDGLFDAGYGGGGGGGGYYGNGKNASGFNHGVSTGGGNGGIGSTTEWTGAPGGDGIQPGGGGGGARRGLSGHYNGGSGGDGQVIIEYLWGSGSRDLYPTGAKGNRATLEGRDAFTAVTKSVPYLKFPTHYVYANAGEVIAMGHSEVGYGNSRIEIYGPDNTPRNFNEGGLSTTNGRIQNRTEELMGPRSYANRNDSNSDKYRGVYHTATETGIYKVVFKPSGFDSSNTTYKANESWTAASAGSSNPFHIVAWDITVFNNDTSSAVPQVGRVYSNLLNMNLQGAGVDVNNGFYGKLFVQTNDGYTYLVDNNGNNGGSFALFVNDKGFYDKDTKEPLYKSLDLSSSSITVFDVHNMIHSPLVADTPTEITHKMFYALPGDLPEGSIGAVPGDSTWLKRSEPIIPTITNLKVVGVESYLENSLDNSIELTENRFFMKGAYILFEAAAAGGEYKIEIKRSGTSGFSRVIEGTAQEGENKVFWDGKDNNGGFIGWGVHNDVSISAEIRAGEIHIPFFDMELNANGLIVEQLNGLDLLQNPDVEKYTVYWNDTDIPAPTQGDPSGPINANHITSAGESSLTNGHKWGAAASGTGGTFGDNMGMDTWAFVEGGKLEITLSLQVLKADLYSEVNYTIDNDPTKETAVEGETIVFKFTVGNDQSTNNLPISSKFTFTVPPGVDVSTTDVSTIFSEISCDNGSVTEEVAISYNETTRTYSGTLSIPGGCSIVYTVEGVINDTYGSMIAESTVLRPADVYDPDASNSDLNMGPVNPHFECYNNYKCYDDNYLCDEDSTNLTKAISCNNINEKRFMILPTCAEEVIYFEDFSRGLFAVNSGRTAWVDQLSISIDEYGAIIYDDNGEVLREGPIGGATSSYTFAPGKEDPEFPATDVPPSIARIKNGYYSVNPPGYVQMGIPNDDPWHEGVWEPGATSYDPNVLNSTYDWTPAWDHPETIRDMSGAVNGAAFLVRGAASASQSIRPFYEIFPGSLEPDATYTLDLYSYVTYHDKEYMLMDVIDVETGQIYVSVPLIYPGLPDNFPPGANEEGFSLGWVPLTASFSFNDSGCDISGRELKIAIRGSQDRTLETSRGFGHTLIDNITFSKRVDAAEGASCYVDPVDVSCLEDCFETQDLQGDNRTTNDPTEYLVHGTDDGAAIEFYGFNEETINIIINEVPIFGEGVAGINWNNNITPTDLPVLHFKSDLSGGGNNVDPSSFLSENFNDSERLANPLPILQILIDTYGNIDFIGRRGVNESFEEMVLLQNGTEVHLESIDWDDNPAVENKIKIDISEAQFFIYGKNKKEACATCEVEKTGVFEDGNGDGYAQAGEIITYTIKVKNLGDLAISDVVVLDPIFNGVISVTIDEDTSLSVATHPNPELEIELEGDQNNDAILDINETWEFTVDYKVTNDDIFKTKGVYNQAEVNGTGRISVLTETIIVDLGVKSVDPTPENQRAEGWDHSEHAISPDNTYTPLQGVDFRRTNPSLPSRTKKESREE